MPSRCLAIRLWAFVILCLNALSFVEYFISVSKGNPFYLLFANESTITYIKTPMVYTPVNLSSLATTFVNTDIINVLVRSNGFLGLASLG